MSPQPVTNLANTHPPSTFTHGNPPRTRAHTHTHIHKLAGGSSSARLPKAIKDAERACELAPGTPHGYLCLADASSALDDPFAAEVACIEGLRAMLGVGNDADADDFVWPGSSAIVRGGAGDAELDGRTATVVGSVGAGRMVELRVMADGAGTAPRAVDRGHLELPFAPATKDGAAPPPALLPPTAVRAALTTALANCRAAADPRRDQAAAEKATANAHYQRGCQLATGVPERATTFEMALEGYDKAIALHPTNAVFHSNRSACCAKMGEDAGAGTGAGSKLLRAALKDARRAVELRPTWPKAHIRVGAALELLGGHGQVSIISHAPCSPRRLRRMTQVRFHV